MNLQHFRTNVRSAQPVSTTCSKDTHRSWSVKLAALMSHSMNSISQVSHTIFCVNTAPHVLLVVIRTQNETLFHANLHCHSTREESLFRSNAPSTRRKYQTHVLCQHPAIRPLFVAEPLLRHRFLPAILHKPNQTQRPSGSRIWTWLEGMKMTKADQPSRKARKRSQTATDDEAEEERGQDRKRSEVISLARGVCLAKLCNMRPVWYSHLTKHHRARHGA